jgi:PPOX class probable F420-dependent enzyme
MTLPTSGRTVTAGDADALYGGTMIPESYHDLLMSRALAHVATIGPRGEPQSTPVWVGWDGAYIRFSQTKRQQKYRNLRRDPRVALSIVDLRNPYRYLEVRGVVVSFEDDSDRAFVDSMARKYLGVELYPWHHEGDEHVTIVILPQQTSQMG